MRARRGGQGVGAQTRNKAAVVAVVIAVVVEFVKAEADGS